MTEYTLSFHSQECPYWKFRKIKRIVLYTVNPLLSSGGGGGGCSFISNPFEGWLNRDGGLFNFEETIVLVLHEELEYKVEKLKCKKLDCE